MLKPGKMQKIRTKLVGENKHNIRRAGFEQRKLVFVRDYP
jgi:hypothetical protein